MNTSTRCCVAFLVFLLSCVVIGPRLSHASQQSCTVRIQPLDDVDNTTFAVDIGGFAVCELQRTVCPHGNDSHCPEPCIRLTSTHYCWCDRWCSVYGDCCYGSSEDACYLSSTDRGVGLSKPGGGSSGREDECSRTSLIDVYGKPPSMLDYRGHWLVTGCPAGYRNHEVNTRCASPMPSLFGLKIAGNDSDELVHSMPVTAQSADGVWRHYLNMYCAFCRGVKLHEMIPWNLIKKKCTNIKLISGSFVHVECAEVVYKFQPRQSAPITLPRSCFPDMIEDCPGAGPGAWAADLCRAYQAAVNINGTWYKNPHCAVCNNQWSHTNPYCHSPGAIENEKMGSPISVPFDFPSLADHAFDSVPLILQCPNGFNYSLETQKCTPSGGVSGLSCSVQLPVVNAEVSFATDETVIGNNTWLDAFLVLFLDALYLDHQAIEGVHEIQQDSHGSPTTPDHVIAFRIINISTVWTAFNDLSEQLAAMGGIVASSIPGLTVSRVNLTETCLGNLSLDQCSATSFDAEDVMFHVVDGTPYLYQNDTPALHRAEGIILHVVYTLQNDSEFPEGVSRQVLSCNSSTTLLCYHITLSGPSQYLVQEGVMQFKVDGRVYESTQYLIFPDGRAQVCKEHFRDPWFAYSKPQEVINIVGTSISSLALILTFVTYSMFPKLRTVPGKATMHFVVALFAAEILLLIGGYIPRDSTDVCTAMAVVLHYIWLACFFWMTALGYDVSRTFSVRAGPRLIDSSGHALMWMCLFSWGTPVVALIVCLPLHFISPSTTGIDFSYGRGGTCWIRSEMANLVAFGLPVMASLIVNSVLFAKTIVGLRASKKITSFIERDRSAMQRAGDEFFIYLKVSVLMGLTWIWFFVAGFTGATVLLYVATILNAFHGVFVFLAFVCTRRVWTMWRRKLNNGRRRNNNKAATTSSNTISGKSAVYSDGNATKTSSMAMAESLAKGSPSRERIEFNGTHQW